MRTAPSTTAPGQGAQPPHRRAVPFEGYDTLCGGNSSTPQQRYCDFACMQLRTVVVVNFGTVLCERLARAA